MREKRQKGFKHALQKKREKWYETRVKKGKYALI